MSVCDTGISSSLQGLMEPQSFCLLHSWLSCYQLLAGDDWDFSLLLLDGWKEVASFMGCRASSRT